MILPIRRSKYLILNLILLIILKIIIIYLNLNLIFFGIIKHLIFFRIKKNNIKKYICILF